MSHRDHSNEAIEEIVFAIARVAWSFRTELVFFGTAGVIFFGLTRLLNASGAAIVTGLVVGAVLAIGPVRRWLLHRLRLAHLRRVWVRASIDCGLENHQGRVPTVRKLERIPAGDKLLIRIPRGRCAADIEKQAEPLAATLGVREVRVKQVAANAAWATVVVARYESLDTDHPIPWPLEHSSGLSLWDPIPVGVDENGEQVFVSLPERNILIGGEPGSGKSVAMSLLVAAAALDPEAKLWIFDGKMVELAAWSGVAQETVGIDGERAIQVLRMLREEMDRRYQDLLTHKQRKVTRESGWALQVVVCDELAYYLTLSDRKQRAEFAELLRDLVSRGRAAGIVVIAATQKPGSDIVPTALRDLFGFRWAMRCNTPQASDTILGGGWATLGHSAAQIPGGLRGVGLLLAEESEPVRLRSYYLNDGAIESIATRAQRDKQVRYREDAT